MENSLLNRNVNFVEKSMVIEYGDRKIKFCNNILQVIQKYVQSERKSYEAGGILIGRENCGNSNLIIEFITEPMTADQRSRSRFLRKDKRHLDFFKKLYEENEGVYGYMGEWHTHPENIPQYSFIDRRALIRAFQAFPQPSHGLSGTARPFPAGRPSRNHRCPLFPRALRRRSSVR